MISERTRRRAALLMQVSASNPKLREVRKDIDALAVALFGRHDSDAVELAAAAWCAVDPEPLGITDPNDPVRDAEAEAMLRCGWSP